jgi:hypothetical protein
MAKVQLMVAKGQWVLVFGDAIQVMSHLDVTAKYDVREGPQPTGTARGKNRTGANKYDEMSERGWRVLRSLFRLGGTDRRTREITKALGEKDARQASARLAQAQRHGLVTRRLPAGSNRGFLWSLTDAGRARLSNIAE